MKKILNYYGLFKTNSNWRKFLLTMKITTFLLFFGLVNLIADPIYSQNTKISLDMQDATIESILSKIEDVSEFYFLFNQKLINVDRKVNIVANDEPIKDILGKILTNDVRIIVSDRQIVLTPQSTSLELEEFMQQQLVTGGVTDATTGEPMPGVNVVIKGTDIGVLTDYSGKYSINVPDPNSVLIFTFIGYSAQEISLTGQRIVDVRMIQGVEVLEEVVVIGYGTVKKKDLTGAVTRLNAEDLHIEATSNLTSMLRGSVPGLLVNFNTTPKGLSSSSDMLIRGQTSLRDNAIDLAKANAPLFVVDGMIYYGDLTDINPIDIESFDILKDASSAAIYGSRASNGIVIITTKKGRQGKPIVNVNTSTGLAYISPVHYDLMNGEQYIAWRIDGFETNERNQIKIGTGYYQSYTNLPAGVTLDQWKAYDGSSTATDLDAVWLNRLGFAPIEIANYKAGRETDFSKYIWQTGLTQDYNLSLSGGSDNVSYYFSLGYTDNEGIRYNEEFSTIRSRINMEVEVTNWLKIGANAQMAFRDESPIAIDYYAFMTPYSSMFEEDGKTLMFAPSGWTTSPNFWLEMTYHSRFIKYNTLNSKIYGTLILPFGFTFISELIPRFEWNRDYESWSSGHPSWFVEGGRASRQNTTVFEWQINNILKWNKTFDIHNFDLTVVQNAEKYQYWRDYMYRQRFLPSDVLGYHRMEAASENLEISSNDEVSTGDALLARLNYTLMSKYNITTSFRRDGYSAFGQSNPRASFWSVAGGWTISKENFFNVSWIDQLKLRFSYGTNGNRGVGIYDALANLNAGKAVYITNGIPGYVSQLYVSRMANPNLKWEQTSAYNIGTDFSFFEGSLKGNFEAYYMITKNLLIPRQLPNTTGYASVMSNMGQVNNRGLEIGLNSINISSKDFSWVSDFSLSFNRSKIIHLYGDYITNPITGEAEEMSDITNQWFIGHAIDQIWDYKTLGIWQESEAAEAAKYSRSPGDYKLEDLNGDGYYTNDDKQFQGYKIPPFRLTFRNNIQYKNWELSIKMYSYLGHFKYDHMLLNSNGYYNRINYFDVSYWTPTNPGNKWARIDSYEKGFSVWENNSFVRIDNVILSYNIPKSLLNKFRIVSCRLSVVSENPFVWAPYWSAMDPESDYSNSKNLYTPSHISFKLDLTL